MSKSVLISIRPEWCEKIASGEKTIEVRKTRPKIETPFKCYIYCTKPKRYCSDVSLYTDELYRLPSGEIKFGSSIELSSFPDQWNKDNFLNGKIIGEFVCDSITEYMPEFWPGDDVYNAVWVYDTDETGVDHDFMYAIMSNEDDTPRAFEKAICMSIDALKEYLGTGELLKPFYGWRISDLVIYDKPKELSEFFMECRRVYCTEKYEHYGADCHVNSVYQKSVRPVKRPPQSLCYVEQEDKQ